MKRIRKYLAIVLTFIGMSVLASQCFAQSETQSADDKILKDRQYLEMINKLYYIIKQNYVDDVDPHKLYEGAIRGMFESLDDPYSVYMDKSEWRSLTDTTVGSFGGVGLTITKNPVSTEENPAYVKVAEPLDNTPGAKAGILSGDEIIKIDGVDTSTITMDEVLNMLRGTIGESVTVTIRRRKTIEFERTLVRAKIENPTVKYGMIDSIGYIKISEFSTKTAERVQEALDFFKKDFYRGIIIDLRNNGGGLLTAAVDIADKFIDNGLIVSTKSRIAYENSVYHATKTKTVVRNMPVVVLINGASASASEILSGALKDSKTAYLVGQKTYGKGSVQIPSELLDKDGFKITIARYYTPSDVNIDKVGIKPDLEVLFPELTEDEVKALDRLEKSEEIVKYVESNPELNESQIASYAYKLKKSYNIEERILRKLVRNEIDRMHSSRLYDLDFDIQLNAALDVIRKNDFQALMKTTKTLKEEQLLEEALGEKK